MEEKSSSNVGVSPTARLLLETDQVFSRLLGILGVSLSTFYITKVSWVSPVSLSTVPNLVVSSVPASTKVSTTTTSIYWESSPL